MFPIWKFINFGQQELGLVQYIKWVPIQIVNTGPCTQPTPTYRTLRSIAVTKNTATITFYTVILNEMFWCYIYIYIELVIKYYGVILIIL